MTKTQENLQAAFAGESQANHRYLAFAKKAEQDGLLQIARLFRAVAHAETVHALNHLRAMDGVGSTEENLNQAMAGETHEVVEMSPPYMQAAQDEENRRAYRSFEMAWEVEKVHEKLYREALELLASGGGKEADYEYYVCPVCGYTHARTAPDRCPVCGAPGSRFEVIG